MQLIVYSFLRSPHSDVSELPKQDANFLTHTYFLPSIGNRAFPVLVILIHPKADYAGMNILLSGINLNKLFCILCAHFLIFFAEIFATPVVVSIVEELVGCLIAKSPSVDSLLDNFQLNTISEKFTVRRYLHDRSMFELTAHNVHFRFIQVFILSHIYSCI